MSEYSLEELKELALPALRHAELVTLARTETPSKAQELAATRWPKRQAKASRFLAMVRRDYGPEALEAFILEHARRNCSEHVQGETSMLDQVYPEGVRDVMFFHDYPRHDPKTLRIMNMNEHPSTQTATFEEQVAQLGLTERKKKLLVRRICNSMLKQWAHPDKKPGSYGMMWESAALAVRTYLPEDQKFYRKMLLTAVVYAGGWQKDPRGFAMGILPEPSDNPTLQDVLDYLLRVGCTENEVRAAWVEMLWMRVRAGYDKYWVYTWWRGLKLARDTVSQNDLLYSVRNAGGEPAKRFEELRRQMLLEELHKYIVDSRATWSWRQNESPVVENEMEMVQRLLWETESDWRESEATQEIVEQYFMEALSNGEAGKAFYFFIRFGRDLDLWKEYGAIYAHEQQKSRFEMLMRGAIDLAKEKKQFGRATALAEYLGEWDMADELRKIARFQEQRVALDFAFYPPSKANPNL